MSIGTAGQHYSVPTRQYRIRLRSIVSTVFLLDVFFLPVFGLPVPMSAPLLAAWFLSFPTVVGKRLFTYSLIAMVAAAASFFVSVYLLGTVEGYFTKAAINTGVFCYLLIGIMLMASSAPVDILRYLKTYLLFLAGLALLFLLDQHGFFYVRSFWSMSGNVIDFDALNSTVRYTGTMSDPNNIATMAVAVCSFVIFRQEHRLFDNLFWLAVTGTIVVASMSATGAALLLAVAGFYLLTARLIRQRGPNVAVKIFLCIVLGSAAIGVFGAVNDHPVVSLAFERASEASLTPRLEKWETLLTGDRLLSSTIVGQSVVLLNGERFAPHNGHLHVLFSFGAIAYIAFLVAAFPFPANPMSLLRHSKQYAFLAIIFVGFTMNVGIYEPRFAGLWAILVGYLYIEKRMKMRPRIATRSHHSTVPANSTES